MLRFMLCSSSLLAILCFSAFSAELLRPQIIDGVVQGVRVTNPGKYEISVGDAFEISYGYPIVPATIPKSTHVSVVGQENEPEVPFTIIGPLSVVRPNVVGGGELIVLILAKEPCKAKTIQFTVDSKDYLYELSAKQKEK